MRIAPYTPEHREEMHHICLSTASERARTEETHARFTLLMYCDPYLDHGTALMLLDDEGVARGYTLLPTEFDTWKDIFEPYREEIRALGPEYAARVDDEYAYFEEVADDYPVHLHIDIEDGYQGGGNGRALIEALLRILYERKIPAISFGVASANTRAAGFYEHMGFERVPELEDNGYVFAMRYPYLEGK